MNGKGDFNNINYQYSNGYFEFHYKHISLFKLSDILDNKSWEDSSGILDLDETNRLRIGVDEI